MAIEIMHAECGELAYNLLTRALAKLKETGEYSIQVIHNDTRIYVYRDSNMDDLCEKFDLARKVQQLESQYRR